MKHCMFYLLVLFPGLLFCQNYQDICSPGITFFEAPDGYLGAFRQDSAYSTGNSDSIFLSYHAIRDSVYYSCKDTTNGSILGIKVFKRHDGWFFFFNMHQDTLKLNTQADLNQPWNFFDLGNGNRIEGTVTQILTDTVLGITDSVKIIVFQAKNSSNQNIAHLLNGKQIRLSEHFGLSLMFDTYFFPDDTTSYTLAGKTCLSLGLPDISAADIFNYGIGDEFHYSGVDQYNGGVFAENAVIKTILDKEIFGSNDSVSFQEEYCKHTLLHTQYGIIVQNSYDTIQEGYNLSNNPGMQRLPWEFAPEWPSMSAFSEYKRKSASFGGKITQEIYDGDTYSSDPPCYGPPFEGSGMVTYSVGLGQTGSWSAWWNGTGMVINSLSLVYYKLGSEEWGTPISTDCNTLVPVRDHPMAGIVKVSVIPNPVETTAEIKILGTNDRERLEFSLFDMTGRGLKQITVTGQSVHFARKGLSAGLYTAVLKGSDGGVLWTGKVIVL